MRRPPLTAFAVALLLGLLCAFAAACGEDDTGMLSPGRAENLKEDLDAIAEGVAAGRCNAVDGRLDSLRSEIQSLPRTTDNGLRDRLQTGLANLESQAPEECESGADTTDTQPETVTETVPTETVPPETTPETTPPETTPTETTPPETTPPETTPPETTPAEPQTPSGGSEAPSGAADG